MFRFDVINTVLLVVGMLNFAYGIIIFLEVRQSDKSIIFGCVGGGSGFAMIEYQDLVMRS